MRQRNNKTKFLCFLRKQGLLCRKTMVNPYRLKIARTVEPEGNYSFNEIAEHIFKQVKN